MFKQRRTIVIHHCHLFDFKVVLNLIKDNDVLFFDDCLYSQYVFLKNFNELFKEKNITCVLGFSAYLHRPNDTVGIYDIVSNVVHDECNKRIKYKTHDKTKLKYLNAFMSLNEIYELLKQDNILLALHGCCHLKLENEKTKINQLQEFNIDLKDGISLFKSYNLNTDIYVYPYAYNLDIMDKILFKHSFKHIYASKNTQRIEIESLIYG